MKAVFKINTEMLISIERPCIDIPTSILQTIQFSLQENMLEDLNGVSPIEAALIKLTWNSEIKSIKRELVLRN